MPMKKTSPWSKMSGRKDLGSATQKSWEQKMQQKTTTEEEMERSPEDESSRKREMYDYEDIIIRRPRR